MDNFSILAERVIAYQIKTAWHEMEKVYNKVAAEHDASLSMGFALLTIDAEGTPVTHIAPRMGMEPNSLSRLLRSMETKGFIYRKKEAADKRKVYICLTEKGIHMREVAIKMVFRLNKMIVGEIENEKLQAFFEVIEQVKNSVATMKKQLEEKAI